MDPGLAPTRPLLPVCVNSPQIRSPLRPWAFFWNISPLLKNSSISVIMSHLLVRCTQRTCTWKYCQSNCYWTFNLWSCMPDILAAKSWPILSILAVPYRALWLHRFNPFNSPFNVSVAFTRTLAGENEGSGGAEQGTGAHFEDGSPLQVKVFLCGLLQGL